MTGSIIFIVLGLYFAIKGLATVITRRLYTFSKKGIEQYTPESCRTVAPFYGAARLIIGAGFLVAALSYFVPAFAFLSDMPKKIIVVVASIVVASPLIVTGFKKFVKK